MFNLFRRQSPEDKERARLDALLAHGRGCEGFLTDVQEDLVYYSYEVRGVTYHAAQDLSLIQAANISRFLDKLGPVTVRYSTANPANSIVIAKNWSGIRGEKLHDNQPNP